MRYKCTNGHDKCKEMYPCKECPYCEKVIKIICHCSYNPDNKKDVLCGPGNIWCNG